MSTLLLLLAFHATGALPAQAQAARTGQPNLLILVADDLGCRH